VIQAVIGTGLVIGVAMAMGFRAAAGPSTGSRCSA
jgi:hypothetical protein